MNPFLLRTSIIIFFMVSQFIPAAQNVNTIQDSTSIMDEVVVTGQYHPQSLKQSVYKVRVIGSATIKQRAANDIITILNNETGIRFSTDHTLGETDISLMGMSGQNVKILVDGIALVDRGSIRQSLAQIDINTVERIEIVEGPMSVVYGTDALAGVINIITKKPATVGRQLSVHARIQEETTGNNYSFLDDGMHHGSAALNWSHDAWSAGISFSRIAFGGWTGNAPFRAKESNPKDQYHAGVHIGYRKKDMNTWYRFNYLNEDIFVAGALNPNNYRARDQHYYTNRFNHQLQNEWRISEKLRFNSALSYQDYRRQTETYTIDYATGTKTFSTDPGEQDITKFQSLFFRSTGHLFISSKLSIQPGLEVKHDHTSGHRIEGEPSITDYSIFASAEIKPMYRLSLRPGIRFSKNSIYQAPPAIPSLNIKWDPGKKTSLRFSYARGFRAPILRELYFHYFDANHSIKGNPYLKAETSNSLQASISSNLLNKNIHWHASLSAFYNDFNNRISLAAAPGNIFSYFNLEKYRTTGFTIDNQVRWKDLSASLGFSFVGRYNMFFSDPMNNGKDLPQFNWSPELNSNLVYRFTKLRGSIGLFYKYTGSLPSYASGVNSISGETEIYLTRVASFHWADLTLSKEVLTAFNLQAGIRNLFNVVRINNTAESSGSTHGTSGPILTGYGRSCFIGLSFQINKN